jgi:hypothetical protein
MTAPTPAVTWRRRAVRRVAWTLGAIVVLSGVAPALANAAGGHVANPVAFALKASGHAVQSVLGTSSETVDTVCVTPTESATPEPVETVTPEVSEAPGESVEPSESGEVVEPSVEPGESGEVVEPGESEEPTLEPGESGEVVEPGESEEPTLEPGESVEPGESEEPDDCATPTPEASEEPAESEAPESEAPETEAPETEAPEDGHGEVVSTVAHCAPKGKDPLLDVEGAPANHGGYVRAAAHGESLTTPWGTFDLSGQGGADALCTALDAARAALPPAAGKQHGRPDHARPAKPAKPAKVAKTRGARGHGKHAGPVAGS